mmetsp:Transcript_9033/g.26281  ORF Transcript_9033/g.26281 Transcript_9033/m.26281 type:complete len:204 (-) Transcript_9033:997-1608(-)
MVMALLPRREWKLRGSLPTAACTRWPRPPPLMRLTLAKRWSCSSSRLGATARGLSSSVASCTCSARRPMRRRTIARAMPSRALCPPRISSRRPRSALRRAPLIPRWCLRRATPPHRRLLRRRRLLRLRLRARGAIACRTSSARRVMAAPSRWPRWSTRTARSASSERASLLGSRRTSRRCRPISARSWPRAAPARYRSTMSRR